MDLDTAQRIIDAAATLLLGTTLAAVVIRRLSVAIALLGGQGLLLTACAAAVALHAGEAHAWVAVAVTLLVKVLAVPLVLGFVLRRLTVTAHGPFGDVELVLQRKQALPLALGLVLLAYYVAGPLAVGGHLTRNALPVAVSLLLLGLFNMVTRRHALTQIIGLITMENGLYLAAIVATHGLPLAVELGIAFDLLVAVLVTSVVAHRIHLTFDSINTDRLRSLRG